MANKKRVPIGQKNSPTTQEIETLFPTNYVTGELSSNEPIKKITVEENIIPTLRKVEDMRQYYKESKGGKQVSIYLPEEIHLIAKIKAAKDGKGMANLIKDFLIDNLDDDEIKEAYKTLKNNL